MRRPGIYFASIAKSIMRSMRHLPHIYYGYRYHDTAAGH
ncbi:hypothetical protein EC958_3392 [Escherichia coli O25b:H4-ST131]|uniref:Uncharacterized protein n=1 Tax=Escherichia coli O25b:H4-ST131 TaxID=941322 RepID=A0AA36L132_ECOLX|nr:hypothetical protein EC958_3392 [Escherichia coli O25b:H4-ST131]